MVEDGGRDTLEKQGRDSAGVADGRWVGFSNTIRDCWAGKKLFGLFFLCLKNKSQISLWYVACSE